MWYNEETPPRRCPACTSSKAPKFVEKSLGIWECPNCKAQWKMIRGSQK